jgi:hypothetical protein
MQCVNSSLAPPVSRSSEATHVQARATRVEVVPISSARAMSFLTFSVVAFPSGLCNQRAKLRPFACQQGSVHQTARAEGAHELSLATVSLKNSGLVSYREPLGTPSTYLPLSWPDSSGLQMVVP